MSDAAERLYMFTIYDKGTDGIDLYAMRCWYIGHGVSDPAPLPDIARGADLEAMRRLMESKGLACIPRGDDDPANVIETWL